MSSAPYVLELHDCDGEADKAVFSVQTGEGKRFDTLQVERVSRRSTIEWLWPDHVPLGKVTVIEGAAGSGKTSVALDLAARVGSRQPWPDGTPPVLPVADVLVISRHDEAERIAASFQPSVEGGRSLFRLGGFSTELPDADRIGKRPLAFPFDLEALDVYLEFHPTIGVVVIDPLSDFCDTPRLLAETLHQLNFLADRHRIALIVTVPANCRTDAQGRLKVTSRWPTDAARCVWSLVFDPDDATRRLFVARRTNFCEEPDGLAFRLDDEGVAWEAESAISPIDPLGQLTACETCLQEFLAEGQLAATAMFRLGAEEGFTPRELRAAAKRLGVTSARIGFGGDGHWAWRLPSAEQAAVTAAQLREALMRTLLAEGRAAAGEDPACGESGESGSPDRIEPEPESVEGCESGVVAKDQLKLPPGDRREERRSGPLPRRGEGERSAAALDSGRRNRGTAQGNVRLKDQREPGWDEGNLIGDLAGVGCAAAIGESQAESESSG